MKKLYMDVETYSDVDITVVGQALYLAHPSTFLRCLCFYTEEHGLRLIDHTTKNVILFHELISDPEYLLVAHNASMEKRALEILMGRKTDQRRWRCTMAKARACGIPGSLDGATKALKLPVQKNKDGKRLINLLCCPNKKAADKRCFTYNECPEEFEKLYTYCGDDVLATVGLDNALPNLDPTSLETWFIDQRINDQGIRFNIPLVAKAKVLIDRLAAANREALEDATAYHVSSPTQRPKFGKWLKSKGLNLLNLRANTLKKLLLVSTDLAPTLRRAIEIYQKGQKTSLSKYAKILEMTDERGIYKDLGIFNGSRTGRWTSYDIQMLNLARPKMDIPTLVKMMKECSVELFSWLYEPHVEDALSSMTRGLVIPTDDDNEFLVGDYASIENCVLAWSAGDEEKIAALERGEDLYCLAATPIFGREITKEDKDERQAGKGSELGFQYGGGINALVTTCKQFGIDIRPLCPSIIESATQAELKSAKWSYSHYRRTRAAANDLEPADEVLGIAADILKQRWRRHNQATVAYWASLQSSIIEAIRTGKVVACGKSKWFMHGVFLCCKLPSGRIMRYPYPRLREEGRRVSIEYANFDPQTKGIGRLYGGLTSENETQAIANCVERAAMIRCEHILPTRLHVHDELIVEVKKGTVEPEELADLMSAKEPWMEGLPIRVVAQRMAVYGKEV